MNINIDLIWDSLDPRWEIFNQTKLAKVLELPKSKAVCSFFLHWEDDKLVVLPTQQQLVGTIGFSQQGIREITGVKRLTRDVRESRATLQAVNNYLLSLQS